MESWFDPRQGQYYFSKAATLALGRTRSPVKCLSGTFSLGMTRPGCDTGQSLHPVSRLSECNYNLVSAKRLHRLHRYHIAHYCRLESLPAVLAVACCIVDGLQRTRITKCVPYVQFHAVLLSGLPLGHVP